MRVITKISVGKHKTTIVKEIVGTNRTEEEKRFIYTDREVNVKKSILHNAEKIFLYTLLLLLVVHLIRQDALQAFGVGTLSSYSIIDETQTVLLIVSSIISLKYSLSGRSDGFQSIFNILFGISCYLLLLEQGVWFREKTDYLLYYCIGIGIVSFTAIRCYKHRKSLWRDFKIYYKTQSYALVCFALILILLLPGLFSDDVFMQVQVNDVCISLSEKITLYMQLLGNVFLLFAIVEMALKVKKRSMADEIFNSHISE
ncbi:hypothetical protein R1T16_17060 [Flavobacterium sp. DG1-102-2]|uniref:hypothetical protein n=1 Tax=Flavobacterium sp. DG1-102-2 TaxID=3081663 RepID=UPI00294A12DF|nr:hypothetical protein [Flavobacterium sp. DG1-102-2]MDV6170152.1 hypothetical protein [Flavobacterium sp. DG1-102-2]